MKDLMEVVVALLILLTLMFLFHGEPDVFDMLVVAAKARLTQ